MGVKKVRSGLDTSGNKRPINWVMSTLGEVYTVVGGGTPSTEKADYWGKGTPWVTSADIYGVRDIKPRKRVTKAGIESSTTQVVPRKTLLVVTRVGLGKIAITETDTCFSQDVQGLIQRSDLIAPEFSLYFLSYELQILKHQGRGTTISGITKKQLTDLKFPLPPYDEQQRIVAKIEELFSEVDKGVENLRTAQLQLKVYRQALLKHAFEGKLTADWRAQNPDKLESAEALLSRIQQEREARYQQQWQSWQAAHQAWEANGKTGIKPIKPKAPKALPPLTNEELKELPELPPGWLWVKVSDLATKITDGEHFKPDTQEYGIYFLSAKDVQSSGVIFDNPLFISAETAAKARLRCDPERNDILIVSRGATVGRMCIVDTDKVFCLLGSVILIKPLRAVWNSYLLFSLKSPLINKKIVSISGSTAQQAIYLRDIQHVAVPYCSLDEQQEVSKQLDEKLSIIDALESSLDSELTRAEALRQSILKKAFSGQLVPQDPNDEPASVLLERIRAERAAQPKARGRKAKASV